MNTTGVDSDSIMADTSSIDSFSVALSFKGKTFHLDGVTTVTTAEELQGRARQALFPASRDNEDAEIATVKILYKGKQLSSLDPDISGDVLKTIP